jgi:hypothetical protein
MSDGEARLRKRLDAWRRENADRVNPLQFHLIEVLQRRAATHVGATRQRLDARLSALVEAYAADLAIATSRDNDEDEATVSGAPARGALGGLLDELAHRAAWQAEDRATLEAPLQPAASPSLGALDEFRTIWSEVRTQSQMRQSLAQVPADAGPLNSGSLVHRSLTLMHELSPGYLQHFLAYVDILSWLERMSDGGALAVSEASRSAVPAKRKRARPRTRPE